MSAQTTYNYFTVKGAPGGIYDLAPYAIDTFINEEDTGDMEFGIGVVQGSPVGTKVKKPVNASTAALFEGITTNNRTTERDLEGNLYIRTLAPIGVMRYGRVYVHCEDDATPAYGDALYMVTSGTHKGYFTDSSTSSVAIKGRFLSAMDSDKVALVELFNEAQ